MAILRWRLGLMFVAAALLAACGEKIEPGTSARETKPAVQAPLGVAEVTRQPLLYEAVGNVSARTASTVAGKLMGTVLAVHVQEGAEVREGDLLVTLDQRQVKAQMDRAQASLREAKRAEASADSARQAAQAAADLASATFKRFQRLIAENSVSQQEFEEVESRHRQAQASLAQAEAMFEAARSRIEQAEAAVREAAIAEKDALVRAPYDGRVVNKMIDVGDLAAPGTPFFTIEQEGRFCTDLVLPERFIQEVKVGMPVRVVVDALGATEVQGQVGRIIPSADARSRTFEIKVAMPEGLDLKSGMFARVFIPVGGTGMLLVPARAIVRQGQLTGVYVVDEQQTAHFRLVRTGRQVGDRVEILSGLQPGARYVADVPPALSNGSKVEVGK